MEGNGGVREFAAEFKLPHKLSQVSEEGGLSEDLSVDELYQRYGHYVEPLLEKTLSASEEFVRFEDRWYLRGLLPEIHVGHLNIAEAMIYETGHPMSAGELLPELGLGAEVPYEAQVFALNHALAQDERFDDVSTTGEPLWYLFSLFPQAVAEKPERLKASFLTRGDEPLHRESLEFVEELADENDEIDGKVGDSPELADSVTFLLNYPHWREGTVPLTRKIAPLFPHSQNARIRISFVDAHTQEEISGWVVRDGGYAWGLGDWYRRYQIPVGGYVELSRTDDPFVIQVGYTRRSRRGQWVRAAMVVNGRLTFQMSKMPVGCKHDRHLLLIAESVEDLDALWSKTHKPETSLFEILQDIFPELAKLSGQGLVHAKTLYSAVNILCRCGAVPIFSELTRQACFDPMGDGNWVFDPDLVGETYDTLEEMRIRPKSKRVDLIRDQVFHYSDILR